MAFEAESGAELVVSSWLYVFCGTHARRGATGLWLSALSYAVFSDSRIAPGEPVALLNSLIDVAL